ncbi:MAG: hypothetical protein GEU88_11475 [Solirubrobacterales bacterium]|nr:hypothetical protein [Solirubrobacterales bacterium]
MRRLVPLEIPAWLLPFAVLALVLPVIVAFALVGPHLGLAVGALTVAAVLVLAARARYDEPIEVARTPDRRYRLLVVAAEPLDDPALIERIAGIAAEGRGVAGDQGEPELRVLAPARMSRLDRWASDLRGAQRTGQRMLAISLGTLAAAGFDASGRLGDPDPVLAIEDELHSFPAREVVVVDGPGLGPAEIEEVRRRLDRPVRELRRDPPAPASRHAPGSTGPTEST